MKTLSLFILLSISYSAFAQKDSTVTNHFDFIPMEVVVIVNGHVLRDTAISYRFIEVNSTKIKRRKLYSSESGLKKLGIASRNGILVCTLKRGLKINISTLEVEPISKLE